MPRVMRGVVHNVDVRETDDADDEDPEQDRHRRLQQGGISRASEAAGDRGSIWMD
jgi:hypothetical protein